MRARVVSEPSLHPTTRVSRGFCATLALLVLFLSGFGRSSSDASARFIQQSAVEAPLIGLASWYSEQDPGVTPLTASGEPFEDDGLTAAMWGLPFDSCVQVTNLNTFQRVIVRINDRGPHQRLVMQGRLIDLSRSAFAEVADLRDGLIPVQLQPGNPSHCRESMPSASPARSPL